MAPEEMALEEKVVAWVDTQGYPLELKVAELVRASEGWSEHGRKYVDPETGKVREIDLVCDFGGDKARQTSVQLVIECKHTRDKPWVVFTTDNHSLSPYGYLAGLAHSSATGATLDRLSQKQSVTRGTTFAPPKREGFRLVKALTPNQDTAYQAVGTLMNACRSLAARMSDRSNLKILFVPLIVLDGPLFECFLAPEGVSLVTGRIPSATLVQPVGDGNRMPIKVMTIEALPDYLSAVGKDVPWWYELVVT